MNNTPYILSELANHLMLNGSMVFYSGLLYGKMGISLFFFHYWRYTGEKLYNEYAAYLVDLVKSQIHEDYPLDYERGLAGVGAGFDYLKKNGFFHADDDFMFQIDLKIIEAVEYEKRTDMLKGFGRYLMARYENSQKITERIKSYLPKKIDLQNENVKKNKINEIVNSFDIADLDKLFSDNKDFSFQGGYAGLGLALMATTDNKNVSWINLLQI